MVGVQDVFRQHGGEFLETHDLSPVQGKAFRAIQNCRTSALGAHVDTCDECGFEKISYNSCRNRHWPKCQALARERWMEGQKADLLDVGYFHVVFTIPDILNSIAFQNQREVYTLLFRAVSETLKDLAGQPLSRHGSPLGSRCPRD